jgi:hypothetical protein
MGWLESERGDVFDLDEVGAAVWEEDGADRDPALRVHLRRSGSLVLHGEEAGVFRNLLAEYRQAQPILPRSGGAPHGTKGRVVEQPNPSIVRPPETGNAGR